MWEEGITPNNFSNVDNEIVYHSILVEEIQVVMKSFSKDKCPGPIGWTVELFIHFFYLMSQNLLDMVEESCISCLIYGSISSTFLALIPKSSHPSSFMDF